MKSLVPLTLLILAACGGEAGNEPTANADAETPLKAQSGDDAGQNDGVDTVIDESADSIEEAAAKAAALVEAESAEYERKQRAANQSKEPEAEAE